MRRSLALVLALLAGCTAIKVPEPTGGSKADGTVELSYEYGLFEQPDVQWGIADVKALDRCQKWGYTGAERFSAGKSTCQAVNGNGTCIQTLVTMQYQCTGQPDERPRRKS